VHQVWDGSHLKLNFRRNFSTALMQQWYDLESIASSINFTTDVDALIWQYESGGVYSSSSLYTIINFGGVTPIHILAVWKLHIPPRVHIFLWLLPQNKLMTRDNMKKINLNKPECCIFLSEDESIDHFFFKCIVARHIGRSSLFSLTLHYEKITFQLLIFYS
jgi:hypothetical protein